MIDVKILEPSDKIQAGDYVRQLSLIFDGRSEYLARNNTYSGSRMNRLGWMTAREVCPSWVGNTVAEFHNVVGERGGQYEFVRGPIPNAHLEHAP